MSEKNEIAMTPLSPAEEAMNKARRKWFYGRGEKGLAFEDGFIAGCEYAEQKAKDDARFAAIMEDQI